MRDETLVPDGSRKLMRGAGARSPWFWRIMLVAMTPLWGYSYSAAKEVIETIPTFMLLAARYLPAAGLLFVIFRKRVRASFDRQTIALGVALGVAFWLATSVQTIGLADTTAGKSSFLTGTYCVAVPFLSYLMTRERLSAWNVASALLCLGGIGLVALDDLSVSGGDALTLGGLAVCGPDCPDGMLWRRA